MKRADIHGYRCFLEERLQCMAFVRAALNSLKEGLTQSIKLSEIVWKFQKPYGLQTFASFLCGWTHLFQYGEPQESSHAPLSLVTSGWMAHLSSAFMLYAGNYSFTREQKGLYSPGETGPKLGVFCVFLLLFLPSAPDLCFSHKFRPERKNTRCWVKSQVTLLASKRKSEASQRLFIYAESKNNSVKGARMFFFLSFSFWVKKSRQLVIAKKSMKPSCTSLLSSS